MCVVSFADEDNVHQIVLTDDNFVMYKTTPTELQSFFGGTGV
jgi:hypothetical protein